jgi:hypothetical protein
MYLSESGNTIGNTNALLSKPSLLDLDGLIVYSTCDDRCRTGSRHTEM